MTQTYTRLDILFGELRKFVQDNPGAKIYSADEVTPEAIFLGWVAQVGDDPATQKVLHFTCPASGANALPEIIKDYLRTQEGRLRLERLLERG